MKNLVLIFCILFPVFSLQAQIENVLVETYYISDSLDATDTTDGRYLELGSKTYRIYIDLKAGSKILKIYGDAKHALKIASTANFYNNVNRPNAYFGYLINKAWFSGNPTLALDSWITLGLATKTHTGVLKSEDTDGSVIGGNFNGGGSYGVPGGILVNAESNLGIPLTSADGLTLNSATFLQWVDDGFKNGAGVDTSIFGSVYSGNSFISNAAYLKQNAGVTGSNADSNKVLIAQLTTKGELSFELNLEIENTDGSIIKYVAKEDTVVSGEILSPLLTYPRACGCKDPNFLEFSKSYSCSIADSCKTRIVFGCKDTMACNYSSDANFHVEYLCCYPGKCNDRNLDIVCPSESSTPSNERTKLNIYPNPANQKISFEVSGTENLKTKIYTYFGKVVYESDLVATSPTTDVDISYLQPGMYLLQVSSSKSVISQTFIKN